MVTRRPQNRIEALKHLNNDWCDDPDILKSYAREYFVKLFTSPPSHSTVPPPHSDNFLHLSVEDMVLLTRKVEYWETTNAMNSVKPFKAPGPNGYQPVFFRKYWHVVGPLIHSTVAQAFESGTFDAHLNETLLVLIPNVDRPETMKQFRPISLCNVIYKIISKVLVMRMQKFIFRLINPLQASFIPGHHASDNILIAHEMVHSIRASKAVKGGMLVKLDLEKAYDKVVWPFLLDTLHLFQFPNIIIKLIYSCISSTSLAVLWNGERTPPFRPSRGLRQGDPLSPYLFVLYLDRLSAHITSSIQLHQWQSFPNYRGGPIISHLLFADDLLLFGKSINHQALFMMDMVKEFYWDSGQTVSIDKSSIYFGNQVPLSEQRHIQYTMGLRVTSNLGKYLGVALYIDRVSKNNLQFLIENNQSKLSGWKAQHLSVASRCTLVKFVLAGVPNHVMHSAWLPASTCNSLNRINLDFLWGTSSNHRKMPLLKWSKVTRNKCFGGLNIWDSRLVNVAQLAKIGDKMVGGATSYGLMF